MLKPIRVHDFGVERLGLEIPVDPNPWLTEDQIQEAVVSSARSWYPGWINIYHVNNNSVSFKSGVKNKKLGVLAGVPDLHVSNRTAGFTGLCLELKRHKSQKSRLSAKQYEQLQVHTRHGRACFVCYGIAEAMAVIHWYMVGVREYENNRNLPLLSASSDDELTQINDDREGLRTAQKRLRSLPADESIREQLKNQ